MRRQLLWGGAGVVLGMTIVLIVGWAPVHPFPVLNRIDVLVRTEYVNPSINRERLEAGAIRGYLEAINDPYTRWIDANTFRHIKRRMSGQDDSATPTSTVTAMRLIHSTGYIRIGAFDSISGAHDVEVSVKALTQQGAQALIVDVRNNSGGLYMTAANVARLFLQTGVVVQMINRSGKISIERVRSPGKFVTIPMVVLVNDRSASAAEIFAAAIQENGRGKIVGNPTYGKAAMQRLFPLPGGSALMLTTARYLTPGGRDISKVGIIPNNMVSKLVDSDVNGEDPQLETAIRLLGGIGDGLGPVR